MKHSPGPWHVNANLTDSAIICDADNRLIGEAYSSRGRRPAAANARLMAAAPTLAEILSEAIGIYGHSDHATAVRERAREILASIDPQEEAG